MPKQMVYASQAMSQAFQKVLGKGAVKHIEVPREIKYGIQVNKFLQKLKAAHESSRESGMLFK